MYTVLYLSYRVKIDFDMYRREMQLLKLDAIMSRQVIFYLF